MNKRFYKITEKQYNKIMEDVVTNTNDTNQPKTVVQTTKSELSNAVPQAISKNASAIDITDGGSTNESIITINQLIAEARKNWKKGTKVVKLSEYLKK